MTPIAAALLAERTRRGWNQRATAKQLGVTQPAYNRWESGEDEPSAQYLPDIFDFLGLSQPAAAELSLRDRLARKGVILNKSKAWKDLVRRELQ